ncbi:MAG: MaoC family dehydratase [Chloroflexi bacterium]|nr:MaoC family dehydratase [Chloroflexota bacterium]
MDPGDALPTVEKHVTQERIERYAEASGDFNPIHVDAEFAKGSHFGGTIAHGMMVAAYISEMMTLAFRESWLGGGRLKIRFRAPVYPGDTITAFGQVKKIERRDGFEEIACSVGVRRQNGEVAITGDATVSVPFTGV